MIDKKYNRNADTGKFELIYRAPNIPMPSYLGTFAIANGQAL